LFAVEIIHESSLAWRVAAIRREGAKRKSFFDFFSHLGLDIFFLV
jgi:hypothetical protein